MKSRYTIIIALLLISVFPKNIFAQDIDNNKTLDLSFFLGVNLGATAPMPIPEEVRKINSYNPKINPQIGMNLTYNLNERWGVGAGISIESKGMRVKDEVKYMYTSVVVSEDDGSNDRLTGYFVGKNMTNVDMTYITIPIYGTYRFNDKWQVKLGMYAAKATSSKFDGNVTDGYIRIKTPTGEKQMIDEATFDFSDDVRDYDLGILGGGEYRLTNRVGFYANMSWGLLPYFYSGSNPIRFKLRNIYGSIGITYRLK